ncbi:MAG TPA: hypothetical protein VK988_00880 [Acidimicrobiales bacterium]|nr:hypothetical protein [Acidimicrobiales bacterium]
MRTEEGITLQDTSPGEEASALRRTSSLGRRLALVLGAHLDGDVRDYLGLQGPVSRGRWSWA